MKNESPTEKHHVLAQPEMPTAGTNKVTTIDDLKQKVPVDKSNLIPLKKPVKISIDELNYLISTIKRLQEKGEVSYEDAKKRLKYLNQVRNKNLKSYKPKDASGKPNKPVSNEQLYLAKLNLLEVAILYILWVRIAFLDYNSPEPVELKYLECYIGKNMANKIRQEVTTNMAQEDRLDPNEKLNDGPKQEYDEHYSVFEDADDDYIIERMYGSWDCQMGR